MEQSMPKDDAANRGTVDFRIQKTQVRKHTADSSCCTSHPDIIIICPLDEQNGNNVFLELYLDS